VADHSTVDRGATAAGTRPCADDAAKGLLLDEPTAALDVASVAGVESLITARMRAGLAVLWVTHDAEQAKRVAHRLLVVEAGVVREEAPEWIVTSP
jgi:ABC-type iron transport system FetAB ATPase subunit